MPIPQEDLDRCLDRDHTVRVIISSNGPLPQGNVAYAPLLALEQTGFVFTPRELLHAIGCKTAALPSSARDECLKVAWLYIDILDLEAPHLSFRGLYGSDLQISRSQEVGIGMMCLIAERYFGIPWDQLGPLPGQGKRFDYRGTNGTLNCIFESKGTSRRGKQRAQINNGLQKKDAHHARGERFDVELIISTYFGHDGDAPRILLADPDKKSLKELYGRGNDRYFRLKHYCRVLQYIGLPNSAFRLNLHAREYLDNRRSIYRTILDEKSERGYLQSLFVAGDEFLGRWFDSWLPRDSIRYQKLMEMHKHVSLNQITEGRMIFQGLRRDVYESGLTAEPFSNPLLDKEERNKYRIYDQSGVSVFPDGTVMIFRQG